MDFLFGNLNIAKIYMKNFRPKINNNKMEEAKYNLCYELTQDNI